MSNAKFGFELRTIKLSLSAILPIRKIKDPHENIARSKAILASVKEVGLVEPLMVYPQGQTAGEYLLLDGHLRYFALKEIGETVADCIVSTDDESFIYNARVNRLAPIQEHKMINKAVQYGVSQDRIAAALDMDLREVELPPIFKPRGAEIK